MADWAIAVVNTVQSASCISKGSFTPLSIQNLVDCVLSPKKCNGYNGTEIVEKGLVYAKGNGIVFEYFYPYTSFVSGESNPSCAVEFRSATAASDPKNKQKITSFSALETQEEIQTAIISGSPVIAVIKSNQIKRSILPIMDIFSLYLTLPSFCVVGFSDQLSLSSVP